VPACPCDCEDPTDGTVDVGDFLALLAQWGGPGTCDCEVPPDGTVDVGDFLALLATWGPCP
ncbi:MAG: GC-type dockerin domain-anchored protein, partial [Planctomycetota bacterium]